MAIWPFSYFPQQIIINLVQFAAMWLDALPNQLVISQKWSSWELICHHQLDANKHCKIPYGAYCEVPDEPHPTKSMIPQTCPTFAMRPSPNIQVFYKFFV